MKVLLMLMLLVSCGKRIEIVGIPVNTVTCYSEAVTGGLNITCGDQVSFLPNGKDGTDGTFTGHIELVEVCPSVEGAYKETLLLLDGEYMAFLANPEFKKERLVKLTEGVNYSTTDGRNVLFRVNSGEIVCL